MILSLVSQKGGVGKSTLAISIAWELLARKRRVLIVDADPQQTATVAVEVAKEQGHAAPSVVAMGKEMYRDDQLPAIARGFDDVVIDTPGKLGEIQKAALMVADFALIPVGQSAADVWTLGSTVELLEQAKAFHRHLKAAVVLTRRKPRTAIGKHAREPLQESGLPALRGETTDRMAWQECVGAGLGVAQYAPRDAAAEELRAILDEVLELTQPTQKRKKAANGR
jgi:chromosome partitioning protein